MTDRPTFELGDIVHGTLTKDKARVTATCEGRIVAIEYLSDAWETTVLADLHFTLVEKAVSRKPTESPE